MRGKNGIYWITVCLTFILVVGSVVPIADFDDNDLRSSVIVSEPERGNVFVAGTPHAPIVIDGDTNFSDTAVSEGWSGNGSSGNPYIIDGLDIDLGGAAGSCIFISNTQVNFTISNCNLTVASVSPGSGIYLDTVMNARVVDNFCQQNTHGVFIQGRGSKYCILTNNTCTENSVSGIQLVACLNISLIRNNCSGNYHGINVIDLLGQSGHSGDHILANNICCNNTYGISIGDFNVESLGPVRNTVINNNCGANSEDGINLITPCISSFINNSCNGNGAAGIKFSDIVFQCTIVENTCNENGQSGLYLYSCWTNNFTDNLCSRNSQYGIYSEELNSGGNNFHWNAFEDNLAGNARDDGNENIFDYNFWSDYAGTDANEDYIGDTSYTFTSNSDPHPLMFKPTAPTWNETPVDQYIEYNTYFSYDLNVTSSGPIIWSVNWTFHLTIDSQGVVESIEPLSLGNYGVQVTATNVYNRSIFAKFNMEVVLALDTTSPSWVVTPMDLSMEYGEGVNFQIHALDLSGIDHWTLNDTTHFTLSATHYDLGSTAIITNNSLLGPSTYGLNITVFDPHDNSFSAIFTVTVEPQPQDTTSPIWIVAPLNEVLEDGDSFEQRLGAWDSSGVYWWSNDTIHFTIAEQGVIRNATVLEPGIYRLEVRAYDPFDNYCSAILVVTVLEAPLTTTTATSTTTTTTTTTDTTTTSTTPEGVDPIMTLVLGTGIGGAAVVVIVIVFLRRKP